MESLFEVLTIYFGGDLKSYLVVGRYLQGAICLE